MNLKAVQWAVSFSTSIQTREESVRVKLAHTFMHQWHPRTYTGSIVTHLLKPYVAQSPVQSVRPGALASFQLGRLRPWQHVLTPPVVMASRSTCTFRPSFAQTRLAQTAESNMQSYARRCHVVSAHFSYFSNREAPLCMRRPLLLGIARALRCWL